MKQKATGGIAASLATGTLGLTAKVARAQARPLTFCSWGGALSDMEKATMLEPFGKREEAEVPAIVDLGAEAVMTVVREGVSAAQTSFNKRGE